MFWWLIGCWLNSGKILSARTRTWLTTLPSFTLLLRASWSSEQIWDVLLVSGKMRFSEIAITGVSHGRVGGREFRPDIVCFIICSKCVCWRWKEELLKRDGEKNCLRSEWPALLSLMQKGSKIKIWMKLERVRQPHWGLTEASPWYSLFLMMMMVEEEDKVESAEQSGRWWRWWWWWWWL